MIKTSPVIDVRYGSVTLVFSNPINVTACINKDYCQSDNTLVSSSNLVSSSDSAFGNDKFLHFGHCPFSKVDYMLMAHIFIDTRNGVAKYIAGNQTNIIIIDCNILVTLYFVNLEGCHSKITDNLFATVIP